MHEGEYFDSVGFCPIDDAVWEVGEPTLVDIALNLWIHLRATANSVKSIFQEIKKSLVEARLLFRVKLCSFVSFGSSLPVPPDLHQACFFRSSAMTVSESINSTSPRSICVQRR